MDGLRQVDTLISGNLWTLQQAGCGRYRREGCAQLVHKLGYQV